MTCNTCHADPRFKPIIASGKQGTEIFCSTCHNATYASTDVPPKPVTMAIVPGHWVAPDHAGLGFVVMQSPCNSCHDPGGNKDTVVEVHHNKCGLCHVAPPVLRTGLPASGGTCRSCHTDTSFHHKTQQSQAGDCTYCHAAMGLGSYAPKQMACKGCHVNSTGTEIEIKKFDLGLATGVRPTTLEVGLTHNIPNTSATQTPIQIFDYRACFSCHSGLNPAFPTAPVVKPFHGFPGDAAKGSGTPTFNTAVINDVGTNPNVANMLPRVALYYHPGLETFRRFGDDFAARTGANNYRRYYSTSDYFGRTTTPSLNSDTGLTSRAMATKTGGQLFSGEETIIWRKTAAPTYGTAYRTPVSGYADRLVAPVSYNLFGGADGPYTGVPYFNDSLAQPGPYGEKIAVTKADWNPVTKVLTIWAINEIGRAHV
jgi:hypothetical protein